MDRFKPPEDKLPKCYCEACGTELYEGQGAYLVRQSIYCSLDCADVERLTV